MFSKVIKVAGLKSSDSLISLYCRVARLTGFARIIPQAEYPLLQKLRHQQIIDLAKSPSDSIEILDAGCGRGEILKMLKDLGYSNLTGFDYHPRSIDWARFLQLDFGDLKSDTFENKFDLIILSEVLEHLENPSEALRTLSSILKPNGRIIMSIPNSMSIWERIYYLFTCNFRRYKKEKPGEYGHISVFTLATLESISKRASLKISPPLGGYMFLEGYLFFGGRVVSNKWSYHSVYVLEAS